MAFETNVVRGKGKKRGSAKPEMNVTPLVDVVLVLLIIFMVIMPMLSKQFFLRVPPKSQAEGEADPSTIVVSVDAQERISLNRRVLSQTQILSEVRGLLSRRRDKLVFFEADNAVRYGFAVDLMDALRGAGATTLAVSPERMNP